MKSEDYPSLYQAASGASAREQKHYLRLIKSEYLLLLLASVCSLGVSDGKWFYIIYALIVLLALASFIWRAFSQPDRDWYKCRALAESIKTVTWRYIMQAQPFEQNSDPKIPEKKFQDFLESILNANKHIGDKISGLSSQCSLITDNMKIIRVLSLADRVDFYSKHRIEEQKEWYNKKSLYNKRASFFWKSVGFSVYLICLVAVLVKVAYPETRLVPIDPLLVLASCVVGWIQIKKFNELAASYALTAHEIGIMQHGISHIGTESDFSDFINQAELTFSREHTQWVARATASPV